MAIGSSSTGVYKGLTFDLIAFKDNFESFGSLVSTWPATQNELGVECNKRYLLVLSYVTMLRFRAKLMETYMRYI